MNIFILFGITGDLAKKKVIPALVKLNEEQETKSGTAESFFIGVGRKPLPPEEFAMFKAGTYVSGDLHSSPLYRKILAQIKKQISASKRLVRLNLVMYSALPPDMHVKIADFFRKEIGTPLSVQIEKKTKSLLRAKKQGITLNMRLVIEKPIGSSLKDAESIFAKFQKFPPIYDFYFVDHYLAKQPLVYLERLAMSNPRLFCKNLGSHHLRELKVVLYEQLGVAGRGAFYDSVGALFDVGQNHLLQVMSTCLLLRHKIMCAEGDPKQQKLRINKAIILDKLRLCGQPQFGQYAGYATTPNIAPQSATETFFNISFKAPDKDARSIHALKDVVCTITSGKALPVSRSGIELWYGNGKSDFIDLSKGSKDAYQMLFEAVLEGDKSLFAEREEIVAAWKIAERAKKLKTKTGLIVYRKPRDILK